ncbi:MAG: riboflavin synthase [Candidatus Magasanikbacteria bacterium]|nr:riboflavin synthase [Candidatus Magasanikbacteria bacterium]|tara:strand:+ start:2884 stop:3510 length:627 start_codon:yes stop_codon:yes gene_type:complete
MYTGIVYTKISLVKHNQKAGITSLFFILPETISEGLVVGASVAINGVCLTVSSLMGSMMSCDIIQETRKKTNLELLSVGDDVHFERSAKVTDEIGGHILSGHVYGTAKISSIIENKDSGKEIRFSVPVTWMKYILEKGFIAIDGCSLTVVSPNTEKGEFSVCFIPHTLENTLFGTRKVGDLVNVEIDAQTQAIVSTVESFLLQHKINI